jgi:hypothetical protein
MSGMQYKKLPYGPVPDTFFRVLTELEEDGKINIDKSWSDCEKRVKGKKGALYKKSISLSDQEDISKDFMSR